MGTKEIKLHSAIHCDAEILLTVEVPDVPPGPGNIDEDNAITWELTQDQREAFGKQSKLAVTKIPATLHGGTIDGDLVRFKEKLKGHPMCLRISTKPELAVFVACVRARNQAENQAREAYWDGEQAANRAARFVEIKQQLQPGEIAGIFVGVHVSAPGLDGWGDVEWFETEDGRQFPSQPGVRSIPGTRDVAIQEAALAPRSLAEADAAVRKAARDEEAEKLRRQRAKTAELKKICVPESAVRAYRQCGGDPERLEDDIDNPDYWEVRRFRDAIESQGLGYPLRMMAQPDGLDQCAEEW